MHRSVAVWAYGSGWIIALVFRVNTVPNPVEYISVAWAANAVLNDRLGWELAMLEPILICVVA